MAEHKLDTSRCAACGASFRCGAEAGDSRCWCFDMPKLTLRSGRLHCYCPACLEKITSAPVSAGEPSNREQ